LAGGQASQGCRIHHAPPSYRSGKLEFRNDIAVPGKAVAWTAGRQKANDETSHSFQARPFYERIGFEVCGTIEGYPPGHVKFNLKKEPGVIATREPGAPIRR
jgi:hypothetical protein